MGRKRNQGKARKAANVKAREEAAAAAESIDQDQLLLRAHADAVAAEKYKYEASKEILDFWANERKRNLEQKIRELRRNNEQEIREIRAKAEMEKEQKIRRLITEAAIVRAREEATAEWKNQNEKIMALAADETAEAPCKQLAHFLLRSRQECKLKALQFCAEHEQKIRQLDGEGVEAKEEEIKQLEAEKKQKIHELTAEYNQLETGILCRHGCDLDHISFETTATFTESLLEAARQNYDGYCSIEECVVAAHEATLDGFADFWNDSAKTKNAMSLLVNYGTHRILWGDYDGAREAATFARYFEQHVLVHLDQSQALIRWNKISETYGADIHTLVNFFRNRIPCSCLDLKRKEVKSITKICFCFNEHCKMPGRELKRSKCLCCERCRSVTYCSRECQKADWKMHKSYCQEI